MLLFKIHILFGLFVFFYGCIYQYQLLRKFKKENMIKVDESENFQTKLLDILIFFLEAQIPIINLFIMYKLIFKKPEIESIQRNLYKNKLQTLVHLKF